MKVQEAMDTKCKNGNSINICSYLEAGLNFAPSFGSNGPHSSKIFYSTHIYTKFIPGLSPVGFTVLGGFTEAITKKTISCFYSSS